MKPEQPNNRIGYFPKTPSSPVPPRRQAGAVPPPGDAAYDHTPKRTYGSMTVSGYRPPEGRSPASARSVFTVRKYLPFLLLAVCVCVFVTSASLLINYFVNIASSRSASSHLNEIYASAVQETIQPTAVPSSAPTSAPSAVSAAALQPVHQPAATAPASRQPASSAELWPTKYPNNPGLRVSSVFYQLQAQNQDIVGWIKIDGVLEEAVVQRDNEYYLTHNVLKKKSVTGALFLDETCDLKTVPTQMLIHGHNMKEGAMFGSLKKYKVKDASFYRSHPFIEFNTLYENGRYVIFAVAEVDIRHAKPDYLPFWQNVRFSSPQAFSSYISKARALSHYRCNVDVVPGDRLLTLSTCTGTDDHKRLIIMARKIRDDENELELQMDILSTSDR